jgi:hypothetical protein
MDATPAVTGGDNAAFAGAFGDNLLATFTGTVNLPGNSDGRMGVLTPEATVPPALDRASLWGYLTATQAYTPIANEVFNLTLEVAEAI